MLALLIRYVPTPDDTEMYKSYKGDVSELHMVDQYMMAVSLLKWLSIGQCVCLSVCMSPCFSVCPSVHTSKHVPNRDITEYKCVILNDQLFYVYANTIIFKEKITGHLAEVRCASGQESCRTQAGFIFSFMWARVSSLDLTLAGQTKTTLRDAFTAFIYDMPTVLAF